MSKDASNVRWCHRVNVAPTPKAVVAAATAVDAVSQRFASPTHVTGVGKVLPTVKLNQRSMQRLVGGKQPQFLRPPYSNAENVYVLALRSKVGTEGGDVHDSFIRSSREVCGHILEKTWETQLLEICSRIHRELAPWAGGVRADFSKVLLYRQGDHFQQHQDAQKGARNFGTLNFVLPTSFQGGHFCISNTMKEPEVTSRVGNFGNSVSGQDGPGSDGWTRLPLRPVRECAWVAFYTDVSHRILEVMEGTRVVLAYHLHFTGTILQNPLPALPDLKNKLREAVEIGLLALPLRHLYAPASLCAKNLKGLDAQLFFWINQNFEAELRFVLHHKETQVWTEYFTYRGKKVLHEEDDHNTAFSGLYLLDQATMRRLCKTRNLKRPLKELARSFAKEKAVGKKTKQTASNASTSTGRSKFQSVQLVQSKVNRSSYDRDPNNAKTYDVTNDLDMVDQDEMGWLGNFSPPAEYFYLRTAILLKRVRQKSSAEKRGGFKKKQRQIKAAAMSTRRSVTKHAATKTHSLKRKRGVPLMKRPSAKAATLKRSRRM